MKIRLLLFTLFLSGTLYAQPFLPMLEEDRVWSVDIYINPFDPGCEICGCCSYTVTQQVSVSGTIVVDGRTYKRVYNNEGETSCLLREDNGRVYRYSETLGDDVLYYDFNLGVGEVFQFQFTEDQYCSWDGFNNSVSEIEVTNVTNQFIAGEDRKVIEFDHFNELGIQETWIEGIGSVLGFDPIGETIDITFGTALVCFTENDVITFFNDATSCDNTTLHTDDFVLPEVVLYPNPVQGTSVLQFSSEGLVDTVQIIDRTGKVINEERVTRDFMTISAMQYPSGLYFYQAISEGKILTTEKFIIK